MRPFGRNSAKVAFILDYPTKPELAGNQATTGYVGDYLQRWIKMADPTLHLSDCYVTHFIKEEIPAGRIRKVDEKNFPKYLEKLNTKGWLYHKDALREELSGIQPNVIFLVGEAAVQALTGEIGMDKYRGTVMNVDKTEGKIDQGFKLFPIYHPRQVQTQYNRMHITLADIQKGLKYKNDPNPYVSDIFTWVCRSPNELDGYFSRAERYVRERGTNVANDIETYFNFITAMGYSYDGREGVSVPLIDKTMAPRDLALIYYKISSFFNDTGIRFTGHNYIYDCHYLAKHGFISFDHFRLGNCTMNLGKTVYPELPASLAFYNSLYTLMPYFKDEGKEFDPTKTRKDQLYHYNAKDCISTHQVEHGLLKDAADEGVLDFWNSKGNLYWHFYRKIDERGIRVDNEKRRSLQEKYELCVDMHTVNLQGYFPDFNPLSYRQVQTILYEELGLPKKYKRSATTGQQVLRTDEIALQWFLLNLDLSPEVEDILNNIILARHYYKYLDYINSFVHLDGRLRTHQKPFGTESNRSATSYSQDQWYYEDNKGAIQRRNMGLPLQTTPKHGFRLPNGFEDGKDLREMFVPSHGYVFGSQDQSSAEAWVVGILSEDEPLLQRLEARQDVHIWTASFILEKPITEVTKRERQDIGKKTRHAGNYDMQAPKLAENAQLRLDVATKALSNFHKYSPNIREVFHREVIKHIKTRGSLTTHTGFKRTFFDRLDAASTHREGMSMIPQHVVSYNQKNGMIGVEEKYGKEIRWLYEAHDGCLFEARKDEVAKIFEIFHEVMERPTILDSGSIIRERPFTIPIENEWSDSNWAALKSWEDE